MNTDLLTIISSIQSDIESAEDPCFCEETNFNNRANTIDFIGFNIIDRIEGLQQNAGIKNELDLLKRRAEKLKHRLEKIDADLFKVLREKIRNSIDAGTAFNEIIRKYAAGDFSTSGRDNEPDYDNLDIFINGYCLRCLCLLQQQKQNQEWCFFKKHLQELYFSLQHWRN